MTDQSAYEDQSNIVYYTTNCLENPEKEPTADTTQKTKLPKGKEAKKLEQQEKRRAKECKLAALKEKCHRACLLNISQDDLNSSFEDFDKLGTYYAKKLFLSKLISVSLPTKRAKSTKEKSQLRGRLRTFNYHILLKGKLTKVCKYCFMSTYRISNGFVRVLCIQIVSLNGPKPDGRGRHGNTSNKVLKESGSRESKSRKKEVPLPSSCNNEIEDENTNAQDVLRRYRHLKNSPVVKKLITRSKNSIVNRSQAPTVAKAEAEKDKAKVPFVPLIDYEDVAEMNNESKRDKKRKEQRLAKKKERETKAALIRSKCKQKCLEKFSNSQLDEVYSVFSQLSSYNNQRLYLSKLITYAPPARRRSKDKKLCREVTFYYSVEISGELNSICKRCFQGVFRLTEGQIRTLLDQLKQHNAPMPDRRGKHGSLPKKKPENDFNTNETETILNANQPREEPQYQHNYSNLFLVVDAPQQPVSIEDSTDLLDMRSLPSHDLGDF